MQYLRTIFYLVVSIVFGGTGQAFAYEANPKIYPVKFTLENFDITTGHYTIKPETFIDIKNRPTDVDGLLISWERKIDFSQSDAEEALVSIGYPHSVDPQKWLADDVQKIVSVKVSMNITEIGETTTQNLLHTFTTKSLGGTAPKKFYHTDLGRPNYINPDYDLKQTFRFNWYIMKQMSYLEIAPRSRSFNNVVIATTYNGLGKTLLNDIQAIYDNDRLNKDTRIYIFDNKYGVSPKSIYISYIKSEDLRNDIQSKFSTPMSVKFYNDFANTTLNNPLEKGKAYIKFVAHHN
ncbi:MAG: hypothetical protein ACI9WC_000038 [Arenicella sp.]|jgi:hypothetical protein